MHLFEQIIINRLVSGPKFLSSYFLCKSVASFNVWNLQRFLHKHRAAIQFSAPLDIRFAAKIRMAIMSMFQTSIYKFYMRGTRLFSSSIFDSMYIYYILTPQNGAKQLEKSPHMNPFTTLLL